MQTYFAVLALDRFDDLKHQVGYTRAMRLLDEAGTDLSVALPAAERLRANRATVEFCFTAPDAVAAEALLHGLADKLRGEIPIRGRTLPRSVFIAAIQCARSYVAEPLVEDAETLLRQAIRQGTRVTVIDRSAEEPDGQRLMEDLHAALRSGIGLSLHYQPKIRARTGELAGAEALLRWTDPVRGRVPPDLFIGMAERSGEIGRLTRWVIDRALADQAALNASGIAMPVHLNISAPLVGDRTFVDAALEQLGDARGEIGLEITETAMLADPDGTLANLRRVAEAGIKLSIDDYGSGYSSLAYLQQLPVHELKIDRMFISRLSTSARDPLLVRSTIDLAHALEMEVTAEGVESAAVLALLQVMRCDIVQGFFLSEPLPLDALVAYAQGTAESRLPRPATLRERMAERSANRERAA